MVLYELCCKHVVEKDNEPLFCKKTGKKVDLILGCSICAMFGLGFEYDDEKAKKQREEELAEAEKELNKKDVTKIRETAVSRSSGGK